MLLTEIDHVAIAVRDLEAAIDYYQRDVRLRGRAPRGRRARRRRGGAAEGRRLLHPAPHAEPPRLDGREVSRDEGRRHPSHRLPRRRLRGRARGGEGQRPPRDRRGNRARAAAARPSRSCTRRPRSARSSSSSRSRPPIDQRWPSLPAMADDITARPIAPTPHPITERLEQLGKLKEEALHAGSEASVRRQHERGKLTARERIDLPARPGHVRRARHARPPPRARLRHRAEPAAHRRCRHRLGRGRRPQGVRVLAGLHDLRRRARRGVRREDPQGDGSRRVDRRAARRSQRRRAARASKRASCRSRRTAASSCAT